MPEHYAGAGERWKANNFIRLNGDRVKNKDLVDSITLKLRTLHAKFRKVKGHNNDQWNDGADALAVMGRDEAIAWPKFSFDIITETGRIPFRVRAMRPEWTPGEVRAQKRTLNTQNGETSMFSRMGTVTMAFGHQRHTNLSSSLCITTKTSPIRGLQWP
jgi:hypothetical protein